MRIDCTEGANAAGVREEGNSDFTEWCGRRPQVSSRSIKTCVAVGPRGRSFHPSQAIGPTGLQEGSGLNLRLLKLRDALDPLEIAFGDAG